MGLFSRVAGRSLRSFSTSSALLRIVPGSLEGREIGYPIKNKNARISDLNNAFSGVKSGDNIFVHGIAATPTPLLQALCDYVKSNDLKDIKLHHLHLEGPTPWITPGVKRTADFNSTFLHEVPLLFTTGAIKLDVALIQVSPPDANGFCSLGTSVDTARAAVTQAKHIIAMSNKNMPRTLGDAVIHQSHIDVMVECNDHKLHERHNAGEASKEESTIGELIANNLVDNGATLQMGIGAIPDAALAALHNHKDLGIHTEMFSDGVLDLVACSAITNAKKNLHPGKMVVSFVYGSTKLYNFIHDNPMVFMGDVAWVNDPTVICTMPKMTAINSAVEIDITGQVVSDSVGARFLSGFGGQVDFIRGATIGDDGLGKPIIALPSVTKKGVSKIVPFINQASELGWKGKGVGAGVVTSRAHVHYVVTEHGIAQLWGKNMRQRAYELIKIAHPDHRSNLEKAAFDRLKVMPSPD
ncbi:unnamed protein product [Toxocara canis]|uniref:Acetyl-CoA hydrolase n=1 Tax=Toxocara canis TaxID=6265 RepID=A0A183UMN5_TOXCA|nr:unnamed protein product [Toxocara canis]